MVDSIHGTHVSEERLGGTDVAGSLFSPDVLLSRLQGKSQGTVAEPVLGDTDNAAWDLPLVKFGAREETGVRATEAYGHTEPLGVSERDVSTEFSGRLEDGQSQKVGGNAEDTSKLVDVFAQVVEVGNATFGVRVLSQDTDQIVTLLLDDLAVFGQDVADQQLDAEAFCARSHHGDGLGVAEVRHDEHPPWALLLGRRESSPRHGHGLRGRGGLVENGRVGDGEAGQVGCQGLEVEQRLQASLADLSLVRGVAGVPGRVLQDVPLDDRRDDGGIVTAADVSIAGGFDLVAVRLEQLDHVCLAQAAAFGVLVQLLGHPRVVVRGDVHRLRGQDVGGEDLLHEAIDGLHGGVEGLEHLLRGLRVGADVTTGEGVERFMEVVGLGDAAAGGGIPTGLGQGGSDLVLARRLQALPASGQLGERSRRGQGRRASMAGDQLPPAGPESHVRSGHGF